MTELEFDDLLQDKIVGIYFRMTYMGFGENEPEDYAFLAENEIAVAITRETWHNGYESDSHKLYKNGMSINTPFTLKSMNVGRSSSTLELVERPGVEFNSVNFKFLKL